MKVMVGMIAYDRREGGKKEEDQEEGREGKIERKQREDSRNTSPRDIRSMHRIACGRRDITIIFDIFFVIVPGSGSVLRSRRNGRVEVTVTVTGADRSGRSRRGWNTPITAVIIFVR
jgi:hypothetical protein